MRPIPQTPGKNDAGERFAVLDHDGAAQADRLSGIILSDDLEMGGILKFMPIEEAAVAAIRAGSDLMEICHSPELILRTYEALIAEGERSAAFREAAAGARRANLRGSGRGCMRAAWSPALTRETV